MRLECCKSLLRLRKVIFYRYFPGSRTWSYCHMPRESEKVAAFCTLYILRAGVMTSLRSPQGRNGGYCLLSLQTHCSHDCPHGNPKPAVLTQLDSEAILAPRALGPKSETHAFLRQLEHFSSLHQVPNMYPSLAMLGLVWVRTHSEDLWCAGTPVLSLILQVSPTQHRRPLINTFPFFLQGGFSRENRPIA